MKLHPIDRVLAMLDGVHLGRIVLAHGRDLERLRNRFALDDERVIAHDLHRRRQTREDTSSIMADLRRLAMHDAFRAHHFAAVRFADRLMSETDTERWNATPPATNCVDGDAGLFRRAGSG